MPNVEYCAPWFEPGGGFRASVPRGVYEAMAPRAQFRCARVAADGDVDAGLVDELRTPYIFGARAPPPDPPAAVAAAGPPTGGFLARLGRVLGCARPRGVIAS